MFKEIRQIIQQKYGSQANFARKLGISPATLSLALRGQYKGDLIEKIKQALEQDGVEIKVEEQFDVKEVILQAIAALRLLEAYLDDKGKAYLELVLDRLKEAARRID